MSRELSLKFSHNIIEHLGLKLYQNKTTNVIAELISNSWDADATEVNITTSKELVMVADNGYGMSADVLINNYLVIAKLKRSKENLKETSPTGRYLMGRKGLGKLAPFGIAEKVEVATCAKNDAGVFEFSWFELDFSQIMKKRSAEQAEDLKEYHPKVFELGRNFDEVTFSSDATEAVKSFFNTKKQGTVILMKELRLRKEISEKQLMKSIGRRFTVTLLRDDFKIKLNGNILKEKDALPEFELRIPESGKTSDEIDIMGVNRKFKYWVGFVRAADWPTEEAGIGVYAHGKIAQDRPYFFKIKGNEIFGRYMYGVIEADWIDEFEEDHISTDRTSIDWDNEALQPFHEHCKSEVRRWIAKYQKWQRDKAKDDIKKTMEAVKIPRVSEHEKTAIIEMVSKMGPKVRKDTEFQGKVIETVTNAWVHKPMRLLIKQLWDSFEIQPNEDVFTAHVQNLNSYLVPESLSVAVTIAQKIYALSKLYSLKDLGNENQLQYLLEEFPWILSPEMAKLTANQALTTVVHEASKQGLLPADRKMSADFTSRDTLKPDFVFFANTDQTTIVCVELKSPQIPLTSWHRQQLYAYITFIKDKYPNAEVTGWLVGMDPNNAVKKGNDVTSITVKDWDKIFTESRHQHIDLLAAMLNSARDFDVGDRVKETLDFGGKETKELLLKLSESNAEFRDYIKEFDFEMDLKASPPR